MGAVAEKVKEKDLTISLRLMTYMFMHDCTLKQFNFDFSSFISFWHFLFTIDTAPKFGSSGVTFEWRSIIKTDNFKVYYTYNNNSNKLKFSTAIWFNSEYLS